MNRLIQDLRYATRTLLKAPLFTFGIVLTLALGIGINATMFGVVDTLFLRGPAGVSNADGVVRLYFRQNGGSLGWYTQAATGYDDFEHLRDQLTGLQDVSAMWVASLSVGRGNSAHQSEAALVSPRFFPMLGVKPVLGRFFDASDDHPGAEHVVVLSYTTWQRQFAGNRAIIGAPLALGSGMYTIIGVAPRGFTGIDLHSADLFVPIAGSGEELMGKGAVTGNGWIWLGVVGRLRAGATREQVAAQATLIFRHDNTNTYRADSTSTALLGPIQEARGPEASDDSKVAAWIAAVSLIVLLIACANIANLLLTRGASRRRELAVRASLGAGRAGLMRALLSESFVLAVAGGGAALAFAIWGGVAVRTFLLPDLSVDMPIIEPRMLLFTAVAIVLTSVLTGIIPALQASRADLTSSLRSGGHGTTAAGGRTRATLLVVQVALTIVLLVGAGLFVRSLRKVQAIDLGFDADRVYSVTMHLAASGLSSADANAVYLRLLDRYQRLGGVETAAASMGGPLHASYGGNVRAEGRDSLPHLSNGGPYFQEITPGYFPTMGARILSGRDFHSGDVIGAERVAVVGETFARLVWPGVPAVGKCLYIGADSVTTCTRVVGVAADIRRGQVTEGQSLVYYLPYAQGASPSISALYIRARPGAGNLIAALQREVLADGTLPYAAIRTMADDVAPQFRSWRLGASAFTAFGALALLISAVGIFAVLSYGVTQRTKEIGVRVALGAQSGQVVQLIVGQGLRAAAAGVILGIGAALLLGHAMASLLYQVAPNDPAVLGGVAAILMLVALLAAYLPARRASRVAPTVALRAE